MQLTGRNRYRRRETTSRCLARLALCRYDQGGRLDAYMSHILVASNARPGTGITGEFRSHETL